MLKADIDDTEAVIQEILEPVIHLLWGCDYYPDIKEFDAYVVDENEDIKPGAMSDNSDIFTARVKNGILVISTTCFGPYKFSLGDPDSFAKIQGRLKEMFIDNLQTSKAR